VLTLMNELDCIGCCNSWF